MNYNKIDSDLVWDVPIDDEDLDKIVNKHGNISYYKKGTDILHRTKGPAIILYNELKIWYQNNLYHKLDGPAWEDSDVRKDWYYKGKYVECSSQKEFEKLIKLKAFW